MPVLYRMLELSFTRVSDSVHGIDNGLQGRVVFIHYLCFNKKIENENAMKFKFHENLVKDDFFYFLNLGL